MSNSFILLILCPGLDSNLLRLAGSLHPLPSVYPFSIMSRNKSFFSMFNSFSVTFLRTDASQGGRGNSRLQF